MDDKKKQPALIVAALTLIGAISLPQMLKFQGGMAPPSASAESADVSVPTPPRAELEENDLDRRDLKPLLEFLASGDGKPPTGSVDDRITQGLAAFYGPQTPDVFCMVVTLPDPVASVASVRFDEYLDVVQARRRVARVYPGPLVVAVATDQLERRRDA